MKLVWAQALVRAKSILEETKFKCSCSYLYRLNFRSLSTAAQPEVLWLRVQEGDRLLWAGMCQKEDSVLLASSEGKVLHMSTGDQQLRPVGRKALAVRVCCLPPAHSLSAALLYLLAARTWLRCMHPAQPLLQVVSCHVASFPLLLLFEAPPLPCPALPCPALPCPALPCSALPCPALP